MGSENSILDFKKIVTYHKIENKPQFSKHIDLYKKGSKVLLSFDDGHISNYTNAFPLLKKYNIPAIFFIIPSLIDTYQPFWWDEVIHYLGPVEGAKILKWLKNIPNQDRLDYLEQLRKSSNLPLFKQQQITVTQLQEMQANGMIIANHSFTHPMFDQCTEQELRNELKQTKDFFVKNNLNGYEIFAYPNGNFSPGAEKVLKEEGIKYVFLFNHDINRGNVKPFRISRLSVNDTTPLWKLKFILSGYHSKILPLRQKLFKLMSR